MNVFIIPSWYPSKDEPHTGIFFKEQAQAIACTFPDSSFAISTWGSHEHDMLLYAKEHVKNISKIYSAYSKKHNRKQLATNLIEYYTPAFTWTRSLLGGNIRNIIKANEKHLLAFAEEKGKVDIIHAHTAHPAGWVAMKLAKKYNVPYVVTEHMGPFPFESFQTSTGKLSHWLDTPLQQAYATIAVSPQQKGTLQNWGVPNVYCIPNLTDESLFTPAQAKVSDIFTFFTLARQEEGKGISYLLEAFKLVLKREQKLKLKIGGDGSRLEQYKLLAEELKMLPQIEWLGQLNREETIYHYQTSNAFVLPSLHENLPLVLIEAMACGLPLIGTYCGGPESIITPDTGLLVEPANAIALSNALILLYNNYSQYDASTIRSSFLDRYSRAVVCQEIMQVYEKAISDYNN